MIGRALYTFFLAADLMSEIFALKKVRYLDDHFGMRASSYVTMTSGTVVHQTWWPNNTALYRAYHVFRDYRAKDCLK